jgi:hypothetical protein
MQSVNRKSTGSVARQFNSGHTEVQFGVAYFGFPVGLFLPFRQPLFYP